MSESFEQMLNDSFKIIKNGEVVEGTVISVKPDEIVLNIGYKSDGIITKREYSNDDNLDLTTVVKEGDTLEAIVTKVNDGEGQVLLSYKRLAQIKGNEKLEQAYENKEVLTAEVTQILNGGLGVLVDETRVFIPASLVSDTFVRDLNQYKGQEISFVITEFNPRKRRIIGDRKQLLVAEKAEKMEELLATLKVGDVIEGTVKNVTDFGAFIDLGGVDGLLHISEISWTRVDNPKNVLSMGDKVKVFVKDIKGTKIALSCKFPDEDPWANAIKEHPVGSTVKGKVARMTDFGAFVQIADNVDALLHVSQISREHVAKPSDALKVGQEIEAKITEYKEEGHKISLSIKALLDDEAKEAEANAPAADDDEDVADVDIEKVGNELAAKADKEAADTKEADKAAEAESSNEEESK